MSQIRNGCIARGTLATGAFATVYTVPAGFALLLKSALLWNGDVASHGVRLYLQSSSTSVALPLFIQVVATGTSLQWFQWTALNQGDFIVLYADGPNVAYWLAGAVLPYSTGVAALALEPQSVAVGDLAPALAAQIAAPIA